MNGWKFKGRARVCPLRASTPSHAGSGAIWRFAPLRGGAVRAGPGLQGREGGCPPARGTLKNPNVPLCGFSCPLARREPLHRRDALEQHRQLPPCAQGAVPAGEGNAFHAHRESGQEGADKGGSTWEGVGEERAALADLRGGETLLQKGFPAPQTLFSKTGYSTFCPSFLGY